MVWMPISPSSRFSEHCGKAGGKNVQARPRGWNRKPQPQASGVVTALRALWLLQKADTDRTTKCLITDGEGAPGAQTHSRELRTVRGCWRTGSGVATGDLLMLQWTASHHAGVSYSH